MRILFMGTAPFAVPSLLTLVDAGHDILGVVTQPDKPVGRRKELQPSPVKVAALERGFPIFQPERMRRDKAFLETVRDLAPDLVAYAAYGQIIPQSFLDIPRLGCWNVHGSLLPSYRGAAPIQRAVMNGNASTGVCVMIAEAGLDTGPVLASRVMEIRPDDTAGTLTDRMAVIGSDLLVDTIAAWERGEVEPQPQDERLATLAPPIERSDALIKWMRPGVALDAFIRGLNPKPGAYTYLRGQEFKVWLARPIEGESGRPGHIHVSGSQVFVATGDGALELISVQPAGKKLMAAGEWARGLRGDETFE